MTRHTVFEGIKELSPSYFALVMATGIVSIAAEYTGYSSIAFILLWLNIVQYILLWILYIWRIIWFPKNFLHDLTDHQNSFGFFTVIAGTCVFANQLIVIYNLYSISTALWIIGTILWIVMTYTIFVNITINETKPELDRGINGSWLLAIVATQAIAVLSALLSQHFDQPYRLYLNFLALSMWLWGGMMYIWMISLIFYRYTFYKFLPGDLSPPYWINMGAMAISTLAGSLLIENTGDAWFLQSLLPFLKGFTIFFWATGTWWIPMLFILAIWRHGYKKYPLTYEPGYWGGVFPLGMYTVSTFEMARVMKLDFLILIPKYFIFIALAAWIATFYGLVNYIFKHIITPIKQ
ncbi:MAG TPA: tellurite resistance/C4-dicarboxylate transporter family protein [Bacteroidales bacterium]|nr:tellurite resistance/C4-dicarboxylate transporter family protein [Bacteroidales bacterium]